MGGLSEWIDWANRNEGLLQALAMLGGIAALLISTVRQRADRSRGREPVRSTLVVRPVDAEAERVLIPVLAGYGGRSTRVDDTLTSAFRDADDAARAAFEARAILPPQALGETAFLVCDEDAALPGPSDGEAGEVRASPAIDRALSDCRDLTTRREGVGATPFVVSRVSAALRIRRWALPAVGVALVVLAASWLIHGLTERPDDEGLRRRSASLEDLPAVAILPFVDRGGDGQDYFADGVTEDLISTLGRFPDLVVMSWNSVRPYKGVSSSPGEVGEKLSVGYVVDGSVQRTKERIRISAQLSEAKSGALLWSRRYDRVAGDVFAVQDEIVQGIVGALALEVGARERVRRRAKPARSLDAYDFHLRGRQRLQELTRHGNLEARSLFERAVELDPGFGPAYAGLGWTHNYDVAYGWSMEPERSLERAHELAREAIRLDPDDASAHTLLSQIYVHQGRFDLGLSAIDQAIAINPSAAESHAHRIWVMTATGRPEEAVRSGELALRFDPQGPPLVFGNLGWAYYLSDRLPEAIATLERAVTKNPDYAFAHLGLVASYVEAGRMEDAERAANALRRVNPFFEVDSFRDLFQEPKQRTRIAAALRAAGFD